MGVKLGLSCKTEGGRKYGAEEDIWAYEKRGKKETGRAERKLCKPQPTPFGR
jgi:hypothetical protein